MKDAAWVTHREAAKLLRVHVSLIPKMLRRGDLASRRQRPSLARDQVLELAVARSLESAELERRRSTGRPAGPRPPDEAHEWLTAPAAAAVLGCTQVALHGRAHAGRRWFRLDLLELLLRARSARSTLNV